MQVTANRDEGEQRRPRERTFDSLGANGVIWSGKSFDQHVQFTAHSHNNYYVLAAWHIGMLAKLTSRIMVIENQQCLSYVTVSQNSSIRNSLLAAFCFSHSLTLPEKRKKENESNYW